MGPIAIAAGFVSSLIFMSSSLPMIYKAFRTKDLKSYSPSCITLRCLGNLVYWLYVVTLPVGPVWFLQAFFTLAAGLMLIGYLHYERGWGLPSA